MTSCWSRRNSSLTSLSMIVEGTDECRREAVRRARVLFGEDEVW